MNSILLKYKGVILSCLIFLSIVLLFTPRQYDFYLDKDIEFYEQNYFNKFLISIGFFLCIVIFIYIIVKAQSIKIATTGLIYAAALIAFFLFSFKDDFLGVSLFLNRQFKLESFERSYAVSFINGTKQTKENFFPIELSSKLPTMDKKIINNIYTSELKTNDTITVKFEKGLFGIPFHSKPFADK